MLRRQIDSFFQRVLQILNGNLKTINGQSVVGEGNITVGGGGANWGGITGTLSSQTDLQTALNNKENLITAGTTSQYFRGDKSFQTLDKSAVGLGNVDDTSDINKPVSTLQASAIALKQDTLVSGTNIKTLNTNSLLGSGNISVQDVLVSGTNIKTINTNSILGSGDLTISASAAGITGQIQFNNGGAFAADSNLFWDNINKRLGVGATPSTSVRLDIRSQGALSTDFPFNVRNSANNYNLFNIDGTGKIYSRGNNHRFDSADSVNYIEIGPRNSGQNPYFRVFRNAIGDFGINLDTDNRTVIMGLTGKGKFAIGTGAFAGLVLPNEASSNIIFIKNGVAPLLNMVDNIQFYAADIVAGNSAPHFRTENGSIIKLYKETTAVGAATFVANSGTAVNDASTFGGYTIGQIVKALQTQGLLA